jgi:hypothetical protein
MAVSTEEGVFFIFDFAPTFFAVKEREPEVSSILYETQNIKATATEVSMWFLTVVVMLLLLMMNVDRRASGRSRQSQYRNPKKQCRKTMTDHLRNSAVDNYRQMRVNYAHVDDDDDDDDDLYEEEGKDDSDDYDDNGDGKNDGDDEDDDEVNRFRKSDDFVDDDDYDDGNDYSAGRILRRNSDNFEDSRDGNRSNTSSSNNVKFDGNFDDFGSSVGADRFIYSHRYNTDDDGDSGNVDERIDDDDDDNVDERMNDGDDDDEGGDIDSGRGSKESIADRPTAEMIVLASEKQGE